jgi:O-methyltransferase domain
MSSSWGTFCTVKSSSDKRRLIDKAYEALPESGAPLVFEGLVDEDRRSNPFALLMSLNILIETPGGYNTTGGRYGEWMREAGFREARTEHLIGPESMVVAIK